MLAIDLLGSGSTGNCALIHAGRGSDRVTVALDCGLPQRTARELAQTCGHELTAVDAVLLSHHHADHATNVVPVAARAKAPLFAHPESVAQHARSLDQLRRRTVQQRDYASEVRFEIGPLHILPIRLPHDAEPTHGFVFESEGRRAGFFTDLGHTAPLEQGALAGLDLLVLEFNHDPHKLANGPYPPHIRARVAGERGHLSNEQAASWLAAHAPASLQQLALAHISRKNNTSDLALAAAHEGLKLRGSCHPRVHPVPARGPLRLQLD